MPTKRSATANLRRTRSRLAGRMKGYDSFARSVWRYDAVEYLIEHPPPLPLAEEGKEFLTNELLMHLAFYEPPEDKFATNADALAAHRWRMNLYILWKRSMALRERMNKAAKDARADPTADPATLAVAALHAEEMRALVAEMRAMIEDRREFYSQFKDGLGVLAGLRHPFFLAANLWVVVERYLRESFEEDGSIRTAESVLRKYRYHS